MNMNEGIKAFNGIPACLKLIVLDFDGTLVPNGIPDAKITKDTARYLQFLQQQGIGLVIATGRHPSYIMKRIPKIRFDYIIGYSGNVTLKEDGIHAFLFAKKMIQAFHDFLNDTCAVMTLYSSEGEACCETLENQNLMKERLHNTKIIDLKGVYDFLIEEYLQSEKELSISRICLKLDCWQDYELLCEQFTRTFPMYRLVKTGMKQVEILAQDRSKASEINKIMEMLDLPSQAVLTIGDDENDYEMLSCFPYSYYVGKGNERLAKAASFKADHCETVLKKIAE